MKVDIVFGIKNKFSVSISLKKYTIFNIIRNVCKKKVNDVFNQLLKI